MRRHTKVFLGGAAIALCVYMAAYFLSVRTTYPLTKNGLRPVPVYCPTNASIIHAVFAPVHLLDATYFRPTHWDMQPLPPGGNE